MTPPESHEEEVFAAALRLPPGERAAHLDRTCAGDPDLRQRIEALLGALERAGGFLQRPAAASDPSFTPPPQEKPGDRIGRYKLLQVLGEGGWGVVYLAEQEEPVRRRVALKVIKLGMDTRQVIARFEAERQALALMDHPNIARVLDAGATEAGRPYFVMEMVRGIRITDFCDEHRLPVADRLQLFIQVCQAVQHAHQKGVIHRDLKPSNILVTLGDGVPVPKVIDFGIAKATSGRLTDQTLFTAFEQFIGTPAYMSPEQAVLTSLDVDTRSDVYSLGVLLYELLTGFTPFDARELVAAGFDGMRRAIRETDPPRPSARLGKVPAEAVQAAAVQRQTDASRLVHLLRGDLDWIVMKCLEKDRSRRYETANGLAKDLERHLASEPVAARPPSALYRFQKSLRRNRAAFLGAGAVAAALVMGLIVSASQAIRARHAEREQARLRERAEAKERKSEQVARLLTEMLRGVEPSYAMGRDTTMLREILDQTAQRVGRDLRDVPEVEAELRGTMGDVYRYIGEYPASEAMYRRALELRRAQGTDDPAVVSSLLTHLGVTLVESDRPAEAESPLRESLEMRRRRIGPRKPEVAETLHHLASLLRRQGKLAEAEQAIQEALSIRREALGPDDPTVGQSLQILATVFRRQKRHGEAETILLEALARQSRLLGEDHPAVADLIEDLGLVYSDQGRHAEAEAQLRLSRSKLRRVLGDAHPETVTCTVMLINALLAQQKYAEAEPLARECLRIREARAPDDARTINVRSLLGGCLMGLGRFSEAEPLLLGSYEDLRRKEEEGRIPWEGKYVIADAAARVAGFYEATGRTAEAAQWRRQVARHALPPSGAPPATPPNPAPPVP